MSPEPVVAAAARARRLDEVLADSQRSSSLLGLHDLLRPFLASCYEVASHHARGETHLHLTPRSVLLGEFGQVTVVGWGQHPPEPGTNGEPLQPEPDVYTAAFLAPEQAAGVAAKIGPASDIYALGALLYAILTGQPPYTGATAGEVLSRVREGLPWQPRMVAKGVPPAVEAVCLTALDPEPAERYCSAADLAREIERWMAGERVRTNYVEPKGARLLRWLRSSYGLLTLFGLLLASLLSLAVSIAVIHKERQYTREDIQRLDTTLRERVGEIHRQRGLTSDEFRAATLTLRDIVRQVRRRPKSDPATARFDGEILRKVHDGARRMAGYADQAGGRDLAAAHDRLSLAELFLDLESPNEAAAQYERAVLICGEVEKKLPEDVLTKQELFLALIGLGRVQMARHRAVIAQQMGDTAVVVAEDCVRAEPNNPLWRRNVAAAQQLVLEAYIALHNLPTARVVAAQVAAKIEAYAKADSPKPSDRLDLANAWIGCGRVEQLDHRFEAALPWYDRAIPLLRTLPGEKARLDEVEKVAGECRDILKAVEDINFALHERGGETTRRLLVGRALALARLGRVAEAAATAEILRGLKPDDGANRYDVARCYALCVPAIGEGKTADALTAEEKASRADYTARAVQELHAAAEHGFRELEKIESDPDLDALRQDAGYRAFVIGLKVRRLWLTFPVLP
jgi:tetratricopeptide (TPR) repeat protein